MPVHVEKTNPKTNVYLSQEPQSPKESAPSSASFGGVLAWGCLLVALAFLCGGLIQGSRQLNAAWVEKFNDFRWLVLVEGDPLGIDEVGRFLKQMDGVGQVTYVSPQQGLARFQQDRFFPKGLKDVNPATLPSLWEIQWKPDITLNKIVISDLLIDILSFPGVQDVAYDMRVWEEIRTLKKWSLQTQVLLSFSAVLALLGLFIFLGRLLFFTPLHRLPLKTHVSLLIWDGACWSLGFGLVRYWIGPLSWAYLWGGLMVGVVHILWRSQVKN